MNKLSWFNTLMLLFTVFVSGLLVAAIFIPQFTDAKYGCLSIIGLVVPFLVFVNILLCLYWFVYDRKRLWLPVFALAASYIFMDPFYEFGNEPEESTKALKVITYNVRGFNKYQEIKNDSVFEDIHAFIGREDPDVVCFQEVEYTRQKEYKNYPHRFLEYINMKGKVQLGIFSKYPIINKGLINFPHSFNNAGFADLLVGVDTVRVYNVHMESLGLTNRAIAKERSDLLFKDLSVAFGKQLQQAKMLREHIDDSPYKNLICGDFNNSQYSNVYSLVRGEMSDSFLEKGSGLGRTYLYKGFPLRIDFILADSDFKVLAHKNYNQKLSDHYPVSAAFSLREHE